MNKQDFRDIFVLLMVSAGWIASTIFLFLYHTTTNFGIWAGLVGTIGGVYHWICVSDDKRIDAGNVVQSFDVGELAKAAMARDWKGEDHA